MTYTPQERAAISTAARNALDAPMPGKVYALTGGPDDRAISNGDSWAASVVLPPPSDGRRYVVRWANGEGEGGYADGSDYGTTFATYAEADRFAYGYARAVGAVGIDGDAYTATKGTGYAERVWVAVR